MMYIRKRGLLPLVLEGDWLLIGQPEHLYTRLLYVDWFLLGVSRVHEDSAPVDRCLESSLVVEAGKERQSNHVLQLEEFRIQHNM